MFKKLGMIALGITLLFGVTACTEKESIEVLAAGTYVSVEINPAIEFIVNDEGIVESYNLLNEDAQTICVDVDFVGMHIDDAVELFVSLATEAGFIDVDAEDNQVLITVLGDESSDIPAELRERLRNRVMRYMAMRYINGIVITEDFTQEDLLAQAKELGVSPGNLKLVLLAQTIDEELTLEAGLEMEVADLLVILRDHHQEAIGNMTAEELAARRVEHAKLINHFRIRLEQRVSDNLNLTEDQIENRIHIIRVQVLRFMINHYVNDTLIAEGYILEDIIIQAEESDVEVNLLKVAILADQADTELTLDEALQLPIRELILIVRDHYQEIPEETTDEE